MKHARCVMGVLKLEHELYNIMKSGRQTTGSAKRSYDLFTLARCSMDLFSQQIGAAFVDVESFSTQVGGASTNIAIYTSRLGLRSAAVTAVGVDLVGEFVRNYLGKEKVATDFVLTKKGRTGCVVHSLEYKACLAIGRSTARQALHSKYHFISQRALKTS